MKSASGYFIKQNTCRCQPFTFQVAVEALRKKERWDETQFTTKMHGFLHFAPPPLPPNANAPICRFFFNLSVCMIKLRVLVLCFPYFMDNSNMLQQNTNLLS